MNRTSHAYILVHVVKKKTKNICRLIIFVVCIKHTIVLSYERLL